MDVNEGNSVIACLESSIKNMMSQASSMSPKCCIFRTPTILKRQNKNAYTPIAFSFGPLHHGDLNLKAFSFDPPHHGNLSTEEIKAKYLQGLLNRGNDPDRMLRDLINSIMEVEKDARECYAEDINNYSVEELVKILVIDGCFIIELFHKKANLELGVKYHDDPIVTMSCMLQVLYHDLILLENQVPWMVLEILFNKIKDECLRNESLITLATKFFRNDFLSYGIDPHGECTKIKGIKHFVDLFRKLLILDLRPPDHHAVHVVDTVRGSYSPLIGTEEERLRPGTEEKEEERSLRPGTEEKERKPPAWESLPSATVLMEAGIQFKKATNSKRIVDVTFEDGVLEISALVIHDVTETVFRNLISYEQCQPKFKARVTSYAVLLDNLINTSNDMNILCKNEIIDNWLNPEDAAQLFNKLYHDTYVEKFYYTDLCGEVNRFCKGWWQRSRTMLVRNYFDTPWAILSTSAAVILLILNLVQAWYTIKGAECRDAGEELAGDSYLLK